MLMQSEPRPTPLELAVLRAVVYASLFEYPLTLEQVRDTLVGSIAEEAEIQRCYRSSALLRAAIDVRDGYFFPRGQAHVIAKRRRREAASRALLAANRRVLRLICALPFTRLVALSGSIAHFNVDPGGDLDLFIVTRGARVWSVTLTIVVLARVLGCREVVCANYVIADRSLAVDGADLFSANQIVHLKPIVGGGLYRAFVEANPFVRAFYPAFRDDTRELRGFGPGRGLSAIKQVAEILLSCGPAQAYEVLCRAVYARHLCARAARWLSPEQVTLGRDQLKLHVRSHRRTILERFEARLAEALREAARELEPVARAAAGR